MSAKRAAEKSWRTTRSGYPGGIRQWTRQRKTEYIGGGKEGEGEAIIAGR